jgi:hypothetical protein
MGAATLFKALEQSLQNWSDCSTSSNKHGRALRDTPRGRHLDDE